MIAFVQNFIHFETEFVILKIACIWETPILNISQMETSL